MKTLIYYIPTRQAFIYTDNKYMGATHKINKEIFAYYLTHYTVKNTGTNENTIFLTIQ